MTGRPFLIAVDVEASGPVPGPYSLLSIGACVIGALEQRFYSELRPLHPGFSENALRVGALSLEGLAPHRGDPRCDTAGRDFDGTHVMALLAASGREPPSVMKAFRSWAVKHTRGQRPVLVAAPVAFDAMFVHWYFAHTGVKNPFRYGGLDLASLYRGHRRDLSARLADLDLGSAAPETHHALDDALHLGQQAERLLGELEISTFR